MNWQLKQLGEISDAEIKQRLRLALGLLIKNDAFLLEYAAHERSIAHKLGEYLQQQFPDWHVDCEYNKHLLSTKLLPRECDGKHKEYVYPDINIHHRNSDDNLVIIEIKPKKSNPVNECDRVKLIHFTKSNGPYHYRLGFFIGFESLNEPQIVLYQNETETPFERSQ